MERYSKVKRSGVLEGCIQLWKSLMLWKSSVNTYRIPDEVHDWFIRGQGSWGVSIWLPTLLACFRAALPPFQPAAGGMNEFKLYTSNVVYIHAVAPFHPSCNVH